MNVVDSSGWLEYFANAENAAFFESAIQSLFPAPGLPSLGA